MNTLVFLSGITFLFLHELDAIQQKEWRFFLSWTNIHDESACRLFVALHFPLFLLILWNLPSERFQMGLDIFLVIHALLHILLRNHPLIHFNGRLSRLWIFAAAFCGLGQLGLLLI